MKKRFFLISLLGVLICIFIMDVIVLEPPINYGSNLAYAKPRGPVRPDDPSGPPPGPSPDSPAKPVPVPEPYTLVLFATGALGVGFYVYRSRMKKR